MRKDCTTFQQVFERWDWKPIRNCPGRYVFAQGAVSLTVDEIAPGDFPVFECRSKAVPDQFLVVSFNEKEGGGLISYRKSADSFLHTLCDEDGFLRKLRQLGVDIESLR